MDPFPALTNAERGMRKHNRGFQSNARSVFQRSERILRVDESGIRNQVTVGNQTRVTMNLLPKLKSLEELKGIVGDLHGTGATVVFANGCFDLLHVGHIRYLEAARSLGDCLILGLNSDCSVRHLKGPDRPLMPEAERAEILSALSCVDYLLLFDDSTVDRILLELKPDVHAKGTDYAAETVPERATVLSYGGRVAIVGDPKDHSTREYLKRIAEQR